MTEETKSNSVTQTVPGNPLSSDASQTTLYLTNIRTTQQEMEVVIEARKKLTGKYFQVRSSRPTFCNKGRIAFIKKVNGNISSVQFCYMPCRSWTCPDCGPKKALQIKYYLMEVIYLNHLTYFLTLTLNPKRIQEDYANNTHKYITKLFNHFLTSLKRKYRFNFKEKLRYVWVIEFQNNGNAHLHILMNQFLPIKFIRKLWVYVGGGHIMKIMKVKTMKGIGAYLTNYLVKGLKSHTEGEKCFRFFERRYSISQTCIRPKKSINPIFTNLPEQELRQKLKAENLEGVYNMLHSPYFKEKTISFPAPNKL